MSDMTLVFLTGRLVADPEVRETQKGNKLCTFSVAVNLQWQDRDGNWQKKAQFFPIVAFGKLAEIAGTKLAKGDRVLVKGDIKQEDWTDREGKRRETFQIRAQTIIPIARVASAEKQETNTNQETDYDMNFPLDNP
jgi:single-strand DNA-binding protein